MPSIRVRRRSFMLDSFIGARLSVDQFIHSFFLILKFLSYYIISNISHINMSTLNENRKFLRDFEHMAMRCRNGKLEVICFLGKK
jgi:hypothetical protein